MEDAQSIAFGEAIDRLITVDVGGRGAIPILYGAARARQKRPLTLAAAEALIEATRPGDAVIIATGASSQRLGIDPGIGEMDGPPGAVALARSLGRGLRAVPVFVTEEAQVGPLTEAALGAGLTATTLEGAGEQALGASYNSAVVVEGFPNQDEAARAAAPHMLDRLQPKALVVIEKAGRNEVGIYHGTAGGDTSAGKARIDDLVEEAGRRGIVTIGIGDGGNEIGMGAIHSTIVEEIPYGRACRCPCGRGIAPVTGTDVLIAATVSNWGAYGIMAALAILLDQSGLAHGAEQEARILEACARAGYLDTAGYADPTADGLPQRTHLALVDLLTVIVQAPFAELKRLGYGGGKQVPASE